MNNRFTLEGNLGADPEVRYLGSSPNRVAEISLGVDGSYRKKDTNEKVERTDWFNITFYAPGLIKVVEEYAKKGREVRVEGLVRKETWDSKTRKNEDGTPATDSRYEFIATGIKLGRDPNYNGSNAKGAEPQSASVQDDDQIPY
jgi:single-strand DNA-binding protein